MSTGAFLIQLNPLTFKTKRASAPILTISTTLVSTQACFGGNLIVCLDAAKMATPEPSDAEVKAILVSAMA